MSYGIVIVSALLFVMGGCKNSSESAPNTSQAFEPEAITSSYNPFGSGIESRGNNLPEVGDAKSCEVSHFLVAGYCVKLANFNVFKSGEDEFYAIGNDCKLNPSSCGIPEGYKFSEVRFKVLTEPSPKIAEFLPPLEGVQKGNQVLFTLNSLEAEARVANEGFKALGVVAWLSPFPVGEGRQMIQYEKDNKFRYGLKGLGSAEGYLASSLGYVIPL